MAGVEIDGDGCPPVIPGDRDRDGDVDLADWLGLQNCFVGSGGVIGESCRTYDADHDGDVDLADLVAFQAWFTGAR